MATMIHLRTYAGVNIMQPPFNLTQQRGGGMGDSAQVEAIETTVPGRYAVFVRAQPKSKDFTLDMKLDNQLPIAGFDMASAEAYLYNVFDPNKGPSYWEGTDGIGPVRLLAQVLRIVAEQSGSYKITFHASVPVWESVDSEGGDPINIAASAQTFDISNNGTGNSYPSFTLQPNALKSNSVSYTKRRRIVAVNNSEYPLNDFVNRDGYPLELNQGVFSFPIGNDKRVILNSREQNRWVSSNKLWVNLEFRSRLLATLATHIDSNIDHLTVNGSTRFEGWDEDGGFFLIDSEVIQYRSITGSGAIGLRRGALNTAPAGHNAGATIRWVQHPFLDFIYDFPSSGSPPTPAEFKPVIDLSGSTNVFHWWSTQMFNNQDVRSRAFERVYEDDGITSQRLRQYNGPLNQMRFEDLTPSANKPPYNSARMNFPVPLRGSPGSWVIDELVGPTLELSGYVVDLDGNETRLFYTFNTAGSTTTHSYSPADPCTSARVSTRVGAVIGDLDVSIAGGAIAYFSAGDSIATVVWANPLFNKDADSGIAAFPTLETPVHVYPGIHFGLDSETSIDGFVAYVHSGTTTQYYAIYTDNGGVPGVAVAYGTFPANGGASKLMSSLFTVPLDLPAGEYWCMIIGPGGVGGGTGSFGTHTSRTNATIYFGEHALADIGHANNETVPTDTGAVEIKVPWDQDTLHFNQYSISPIFGVLSKTTNAQANSPTQTGNVVDLSNFKAYLDQSRAPIVHVQGEEDVYVMDAVLKNNTTGDSLAIFALIAPTQSITIDCDNRRLIDNETGLEIPAAITPSNPDDWMFLVPGTNTISYTEVGVTDLDITPTWRRTVN